MTQLPTAPVHLTAGGVSLVLDCSDGRLPAVVHWGAALGEQSDAELRALAAADVLPLQPSTPDVAVRLSVLPEPHTGWTGRPGLTGHRDGHDWSPAFTVTDLTVTDIPSATSEPAASGPDTSGSASGPDTSGSASGAATPGSAISDAATPGTATSGTATSDAATRGTAASGAAQRLVALAEDRVAGLALRIEVEMLVSGLVRLRAAVTNRAPGTYTVDDLTVALPVPGRAREVLDFAGRWGKERTPQRHELVVGTHQREGRRGRTGPDAATVLSVGTPGFGFASGEVWGVHVGWSGNHRHHAERLADGHQVIGGGELLLPGEVRLAEGDTHTGPWVYGAHGDGLDAQAQRFHDWLRQRPQHPVRPRPMTINVWEAVYFDHDLARLTDLADRAARIGVERFVLDDGWFRGRRDDRAGLGDWFVDEDVWPDGLAPLVDHVRALGMEFGLWFEPEMVNEDSDLAREHPEWIMQADGRLPVRARNQQVLDLAIPAAYEHVLARLTAVIGEVGVDYVKWDHNRDLVEAGTRGAGAAVHEQTLAAYRLMAALKERFPALEIESCSSGGSRVDLGVVEHTDRVWTSDCIDPLERQQMNRWTMQLLPPEMLGSHIASGTNHTTGRRHTLAFRAGTALFGHLGIEWDLATATEAEERELTEWIAHYKAHRDLLHHGDLVRVDQADPTQLVYGSVAPDRREALFFLAVVGRSEVSPRGRTTLRGLDPDTRYRVDPLVVGDVPGLEPAPWWSGDRVFSGRALEVVGVQAPMTFPETVVPFRVVAV